jgi:hypothetical protein
VLGLACATKQLAWPFAPFLLGWLSGAHTLRDLTGRIALRRLAGPAAAALGVFLLVVVPVAALDPRRFWADIVVYNAGLPGGDNYPLGGTPGFGFANFVIYAGRVASLRDYAPLGWFYLLLIPLGLLLLRYQLREGGPSSVLVTGSGALLASLYASRVVHPNYLILPAILLPLGFLMGERRPADVAAVPLLLLATAVEIADQALLRSVWEDAVAVRLPQHLSGLAADLGPRAGPGLTQDPLGLVWSALAAGVAVVYLLVGILGAGARLRIGLIVTAVVAVCVVPTVCVMQIGAVTAEPRAQDGWFASASARPAREAWSESFRRDPPAVLVDTHPAPASLGPLVARLGLGDPRGLSLIAVALAALLLAWLVPSGSRPLALAILVSPPLVVGTVFGSGDVLLLAIVLASLWLTRRGREAGGGLAWGIGIAGFPRALCLAPLALPGGRTARRITAAVLGCAVIWIACVAVGGVSTPANPSALAPGVGLSNLFLYWGAEGSTAGRVATLALQLAAGGAVLWLGMRRDPISLAGAAALLTTGLFLASGTSSHDLLVPLALCMLSATLPAPTDETEAFGG